MIDKQLVVSLAVFLEAQNLPPSHQKIATLLRSSIRQKLSAADLAAHCLSLDKLDLAGDAFFPSKQALCVSTIAKYFGHIKWLSLASQPLENTNALGEFVNLEHLNVSQCGLSEVTFLKNLPKIQSLNLSKNSISSVQLSELFEKTLNPQTLNELYLNELSIREVSFLAKFTELQTLSLSKNDLSTLVTLKELSKIQNLNFDSNMIDDLSFLSRWRSLKKLSFKNNAVTDLEPLQDLSSLTYLMFNSNKVRSLKPLRGARSLYRAGCSGNALFDDDYDIIPRSIRID